MTTAEPPSVPEDAVRDADLAIARLHLRMGSLSIARAELESLAGKDGLDAEGIIDLAEVRWRTGDLAGAGEAAAARLETDPYNVVALVIAAEAQADLGRPGEARRLAGRALSHSDGPIDPIFAGMPRSSIWPVDPGAPLETSDELLFADLPPQPTGYIFAPTPIVDDSARADIYVPPTAGEASGPGLWEAQSGTIAPPLPNPVELIARARLALDASRPGQAAAALALALRAEPQFAPTVLNLIAGRQEPVLALVRGDANRIVGHEAEALRDYATAVAAIGQERRSDERPAEPDESRSSKSARRQPSPAAAETRSTDAGSTDAADEAKSTDAADAAEAAIPAAADEPAAPDPAEPHDPKENT